MGLVKTHTGEFCLAAYVGKSPYDITNVIGAPHTRGSVVIANDYYRPSIRAPRRDPQSWPRAVGRLVRNGAIPKIVYHRPHHHEYFAVFPATNEDLWKSVRKLERLTSTRVSAMPWTFDDFNSFMEHRDSLREELYQHAGDVRATTTYQEHLDICRSSLKFEAVIGAFDSTLREWTLIKRYFPVHTVIREEMAKAIDKKDTHEVCRLADLLR